MFPAGSPRPPRRLSPGQVFTFRVQQKYSMPPDVFIAQTAWIQGAVLLVLGPLVDRAMQGSWVFDLFAGGDPTFPGTLFYVVLSSAVAIAVNVSQAAAIGAASALGAPLRIAGRRSCALVHVARGAVPENWV